MNALTHDVLTLLADLNERAEPDVAAAAEQLHTELTEYLRDRTWTRTREGPEDLLRIRAEVADTLSSLQSPPLPTGTRAALVEDLSDLTRFAERVRIGRLIRAARDRRSARAVAREAMISSGYLSQLEAGLSSFPSQLVAERLGAVIGFDLSSASAEAREATHAAALATRRAHDQTPHARQIPGVDPRLQGIVNALAEDPEFVELADSLLGLPGPARASLTAFVRALRRRDL